MKNIASKLLISIGITTILFFLFLFYQTYSLVSGREKEVVEQQASMALKFDVAIRDYIAQYVWPVMYKMVGKEDFIPETMSTSFVARTIFEDVRKEFPNYIIKFSSDNPRNPENQAGSEELKIIDYFNDNPQMQRWEGEISINNKPYFAKFSVMRMEVACLRCHGDPENAPASLLKRYGSTASFHRPLGKVIGMDTVAIPIVKITEQLWPKLMQAFFLIALGLLLFFLSIIFLTRFIVTKRLSSITEHFLTAAQQSNYQEITFVEIEGNDEISDLSASFNSLCDRLKIFYSSLETQVKDRTQELADKNEQMKQEIEERKQAEGAVRTSEHFLKTLLNAIPIPVFYKDKNGRYLGFNMAFETFCGETRKGLIGKTVFEINPPELAEIYHAKDNELFENGRVQQYESQVENAHGVLRDVIFNKALFFDSQKSISGLIGAILDITDRKQVAEDLRKSELKYKTLIDNINSGVAVYEAKNDGEDFIFVDFNKAGEKIENIGREDLIGKSVLDVFPGIKDFGIFDVFKKVWKTGKPEYFPITLYEDERISGWRENYVYKLPSEEIIAVYNDKTEQKKSEEALRMSEEKFRNLFNNAEIGMFRTRIDGSEILEMNEKFLDIFGRTREEMQGSPSVIHWADPSEREEMLCRLEIEGRVPNFECRMLNKQGEVRSCLTSLILYREQEILEGSIIDITERKQAEKELRESEVRFRTLFSQVAVGVALVESQTDRVVRINKRYCDIIGYSPDEMDPKSFREITHPDDQQKNLGNMKDLIEGRISKFSMEKRYFRKDGSLVWVKLWVSPMWEVGQKPDYHIAVVEDVTNLKRAEEEKQRLESQLQQSQKMEAIGLLAGGIAHDFNNMLTTIIGNADFALEQAGEHTSLYSEIEEIRKAGRKAAALTRQLLAFSRKQLIQPEILNLNDILTNTDKMLRRTIGEDIEFKIMFEPELWNVKMDPGQIEQILLNLVVNSRDAMPDGGKLTVETANVELDDVYFQNHGVKSSRGSYVQLSVTDTGTGMDKETQSRIFEPFFTTKERGRGTGLGLSTVYGIVKQNNGHIWTYSEPGKGSTFKVYFPRILAKEASDVKEQLDENRLGGSETILVVEDNETLLKLTKKMLEKYGYKVLIAQSGHKAMDIFNGHDGPIHLLLTDVVMPDMSGRELAEQIQSKSPKVQIIYMSGYTDDTISKHEVLYDDIEFIEKPFSKKDLGLKVRKVLNQGIDD